MELPSDIYIYILTFVSDVATQMNLFRANRRLYAIGQRMVKLMILQTRLDRSVFSMNTVEQADYVSTLALPTNKEIRRACNGRRLTWWGYLKLLTGGMSLRRIPVDVYLPTNNLTGKRCFLRDCRMRPPVKLMQVPAPRLGKLDRPPVLSLIDTRLILAKTHRLTGDGPTVRGILEVGVLDEQQTDEQIFHGLLEPSLHYWTSGPAKVVLRGADRP